MPIDTSWMQAALNQPQMRSVEEQQQSRNALALQGMQLQEAHLKLQDAVRKRDQLAKLQAAMPPGTDLKKMFEVTAQQALAEGDVQKASQAREAYQQIVDAEEASKLASQFESRFLGAGAPADVSMAGAPMAAPTNALAPAGAAPTSMNAMQGGVPQEELGLLARMATVDPKRAAAYADLLKMKYRTTSQIAARPVTVMQNGKSMVIDANTGTIIGEAPPRAAAAPKVPQTIEQKAAEVGAVTAAREEAKQKAKAPEIQRKQNLQRQALTEMTNTLLGTIKEAKNLTGDYTAGYGGLLANVPMTEARKLKNRLDTIKANLGFDRLQMMRDMSPTGGALGQVAVKELEFLQSSIANLDQLTEAEDLKSQLDKIEKHYNAWLDAVNKSSAETPKTLDAAAPTPTPTPTPTPSNTRTTKGGVTYTVEED